MLNIAHRGARSLAPENTLAAARKAHALGADLWETDLAVTADGALILFHDDALTRTTNVAEVFPDRAPGPFSDYTLADFRRLDAGSWFAVKDPHSAIAAGEVGAAELAAFAGEKVPTLAEALTLTRNLGWRMNLELKQLPENKRDFPVVDHLLGLVRELDIGPETVLFSSARHDWLEDIRGRAPEYALEALMGLLPEHGMDFGDYGFDTYNIRRTRTDEAEVKDLLARGKSVNLYVVNTPAEIARWRAVGVSGLITDFPQRLQ